VQIPHDRNSKKIMDMKNNIVLIILSLSFFLLHSCDKKNESEYLSKIGKTIDGKRVIEKQINDTLLIKDTYNLEKLESKFEYCRDKNSKRWILNGQFVNYYPSGKIQIKGSFDKGVRIGNWYYYSEEGLISEFEEYVIDSSYYWGEIVNQYIKYKDGKIEENKNNHYFDLISFQDTILFLEPFVFRVKLNDPMYSQGMFICIGDFDKYYRLKSGGKIDTIRCNSFDEVISYSNYRKGKNELGGIIINYDSLDSYKITPYYFRLNFFVDDK